MQLKFGKYSGWALEDVPDDYIEFMINSKEMWIQERERRQLVRDAELPMALRLLQAGRNALAQIYHPDKGGSEAQMRELNAAYEALKEVVSQAQQPT